MAAGPVSFPGGCGGEAKQPAGQRRGQTQQTAGTVMVNGGSRLIVVAFSSLARITGGKFVESITT